VEWLHGFLKKLAWKPELKFCSDWAKHQWSNQERAWVEINMLRLLPFYFVPCCPSHHKENWGQENWILH
jgi:hypothetical protein